METDLQERSDQELLDLRRHRMGMVARVSCTFAIVMLVIVTGTTWYHWTQPMAVAVHETQSLPLSVTRLIKSTSTEAPGMWNALVALSDVGIPHTSQQHRDHLWASAC